MFVRFFLLFHVAALAGCSNLYLTWKDKPESPPGVYSKKVTLQPYSVQGVDVKETTSWFYGSNDGLTAHARNGVVYFVDQYTPTDFSSYSSCANSSGGASESLDSAICSFDDVNELSASQLDKFIFSITPSLVVHFPTNSHEGMYQESEREFSKWLNSTAQDSEWIHRIIVVGYTDDVGLDDINIPLSARRAANVAERVKKAIDVDVFNVGRGPAPRMADNRIDGGRKVNRRVEIYIINKG